MQIASPDFNPVILQWLCNNAAYTGIERESV